jgi:hypothetical protein
VVVVLLPLLEVAFLVEIVPAEVSVLAVVAVAVVLAVPKHPLWTEPPDSCLE